MKIKFGRHFSIQFNQFNQVYLLKNVLVCESSNIHVCIIFVYSIKLATYFHRFSTMNQILDRFFSVTTIYARVNIIIPLDDFSLHNECGWKNFKTFFFSKLSNTQPNMKRGFLWDVLVLWRFKYYLRSRDTLDTCKHIPTTQQWCIFYCEHDSRLIEQLFIAQQYDYKFIVKYDKNQAAVAILYKTYWTQMKYIIHRLSLAFNYQLFHVIDLGI